MCKLNGWAIESRLYAEDPYRNFLPSIGRLTRYRPPVEGDTADGTIVRNDTGVFEGGEISMYYDPMIAKLCTWAPDRLTAHRRDGARRSTISRSRASATTCRSSRPSCSIERFRSGQHHHRLHRRGISGRFPRRRARCGIGAEARRRRHADASGAAEPRRADLRHASAIIAAVIGKDWVVTFAGQEHAVTLDASADGAYYPAIAMARASRSPATGRPAAATPPSMSTAQPMGVKIDLLGHRLSACAGAASTWSPVCCSPRVAELARLMPKKLPPDTSKMLLCPMPGVITARHGCRGRTVEAGQPLATVEAMKMENMLRAERRGVVASAVSAGAESRGGRADHGVRVMPRTCRDATWLL